tara:strand:- start:26 stop:229 length:204 start_codon:yes stop_codon:yes gene_type:complete
MKMVIEINLNNSAFYNEDGEFKGVREGFRAEELETMFSMYPFKTIKDVNGNTVGSVKLLDGAEHQIV